MSIQKGEGILKKTKVYLRMNNFKLSTKPLERKSEYQQKLKNKKLRPCLGKGTEVHFQLAIFLIIFLSFSNILFLVYIDCFEVCI